MTGFTLSGGSDDADCHRLACAALARDLPTDPAPASEDVAGWLRNPYPGSRTRMWAARDDAGRLVGLAHLRTSERDNPDIGHVELTVDPAVRRRGIATALLREVVRALAHDGRHTLAAVVPEGTDGLRFAASHGMREALRQARSLLDVTALDGRLLDKLAEEEHPSYRLAAWVDGAPDDLLPSYAGAKRALGDAPIGTPRHRHPEFDSSSMREYEEWTVRRGREYRVVAALHEPTGEVAGFTEVSISTWTPRRALQDDTAVLPAHRGHGLGLWMKAEMLRWLRADRPDVAEICTCNAEENVHTRRLNDRLGFRFDRWLIDVQGDVFTLARRLGLAGAAR